MVESCAVAGSAVRPARKKSAPERAGSGGITRVALAEPAGSSWPVMLVATKDNIVRVPLEKEDRIKSQAFFACPECRDYLAFNHRKTPNSSVSNIELIKLRAVIASQKIMIKP